MLSVGQKVGVKSLESGTYKRLTSTIKLHIMPQMEYMGKSKREYEITHAEKRTYGYLYKLKGCQYFFSEDMLIPAAPTSNREGVSLLSQEGI